MKIKLPDGYNGHTLECDAKPIEIDGGLVKLQVSGSYMFRWCNLHEWEQMTTGQILDFGRQIATWKINPHTGYAEVTYPDGMTYVCDFANVAVTPSHYTIVTNK